MTLLDDRGTRAEAPAGEHRRFDASPLLVIVLLAALAITLAGIFPFRQMLAQNRQVENTQFQYQMLVAENQRLEEQAELLGTSLEVERLAREQYGLVRPGEEALRAVPADDGVAAEEITEEAVAESPWYQQLWDFLTGRDLVPDEGPEPIRR